jgi:glycerophosphoryl diester phosphodiesterase
MVNNANLPGLLQSTVLQPCVEEQKLLSKTGKLEDCEDLIHISDHFIVVIDGATSKTTRKWNQETGGKTAAQVISRAFDRLACDTTARQAVSLMTSMIYDIYTKLDVVDILRVNPVQRMTASFVALSLGWFIFQLN